MKKFILSAFCALFGLNLAYGEVQQKIVQTPTDTGNIEIIDLNISPMKTSFNTEASAYKYTFERNEKPNLIIFNASKYKNLGENLRKYLTNELVQSKKFNVLDRKNSAYYKAEKQLIESEDALSDEIYKLGNVLGTDYMLVFNLRALGASTKKAVRLSANDENVVKGDVVVDYQMIFFATRELKLANTLTLSITLKDDSVKSNEEAMAKIAKVLFSDISNTLYPLFVASVEGGEVLFEEKLELNAIYECESKTKANSGKVQVIKTNAKNSRAKIIDGEVGFNDVCKLLLEKGKDANYKLSTNGGVNLGW